MSLKCSVGAAARQRGADKGPDTGRRAVSLPRISVTQRADGKVGIQRRPSINLTSSVGAAAAKTRPEKSPEEDAVQRERVKRDGLVVQYSQSLRRTVAAQCKPGEKPAHVPLPD